MSCPSSVAASLRLRGVLASKGVQSPSTMPADYGSAHADSRIAPYIKVLEAEGSGIPYVSTSWHTLAYLNGQHGSALVTELLRKHWDVQRLRIVGEQPGEPMAVDVWSGRL